MATFRTKEGGVTLDKHCIIEEKDRRVGLEKKLYCKSNWSFFIWFIPQNTELERIQSQRNY